MATQSWWVPSLLHHERFRTWSTSEQAQDVLPQGATVWGCARAHPPCARTRHTIHVCGKMASHDECDLSRASGPGPIDVSP